MLVRSLVDDEIGGGGERSKVGADRCATTDQLHEGVVAELGRRARQVLAPALAVLGLRLFDVAEPERVDQVVEGLGELSAVEAEHAAPQVPESVEVLHCLECAAVPAAVGLALGAVLVDLVDPLHTEGVEVGVLELACRQEELVFAHRQILTDPRVGPHCGNAPDLIRAHEAVAVALGDRGQRAEASHEPVTLKRLRPRELPVDAHHDLGREVRVGEEHAGAVDPIQQRDPAGVQPACLALDTGDLGRRGIGIEHIDFFLVGGPISEHALDPSEGV